MTEQFPDANALLMGGAKSVSWKDLGMGAIVVGTILEPPKVEQMTKYKSTEPDFWPSGEPKLQIVLEIQTDMRDPANPTDDGKRRLFVEPRMMKTFREAVRNAGADGFAVGGKVAVKWVSGDGEGEGNARVFVTEYAKPVSNPHANNLLGATTPAATAPLMPATPAAPAPAAAPVAAPIPTGGLLSAPVAAPVSLAAVPAPTGMDPNLWAGLPDQQKQTILAAMGLPAY